MACVVIPGFRRPFEGALCCARGLRGAQRLCLRGSKALGATRGVQLERFSGRGGSVPKALARAGRGQRRHVLTFTMIMLPAT